MHVLNLKKEVYQIGIPSESKWIYKENFLNKQIKSFSAVKKLTIIY
jgi:hypothetical protein